MPAKCAILSARTSRELRAGADRYALPVADRGDKAQLVDALARPHPAPPIRRRTRPPRRPRRRHPTRTQGS